MAYTKTPVQSTYDTVRINLIANPQQRSGETPEKDFRLLNMMTETVPSPLGDSKKYYVKSRPGTSEVFNVPDAQGRGVYVWNIGGSSFRMFVVGSKVYSNGTEVLSLGTSSGQVGFTEYLDSTGVVSLVLLDGTDGFIFSDPSTPVNISDVNFPSPHIPMPVFLDGYLFVAGANSQDVFNSNLNDPFTWTPGDYISAEMYPDTIVGLAKNNNYIYAIGTGSVEYFYDNANPTGSPLLRNDTAVLQFGCAEPRSIVETEGQVIFVGTTNNGQKSVWVIDGFKSSEIQIPSVVFALDSEDATYNVATVVRVAGQKLYVLSLSSRTLVYSFTTKMWSEWSTGIDDSMGPFIGATGAQGTTGDSYFLGRSNGVLYLMADFLFTDEGEPFLCEITTAKLDFESLNNKFMHRFSLVGDVPDEDEIQNLINIYWSDDDYKTWQGPRILELTPDLPSIFQLGKFRRRAFKINYTLPHLLRLEGLEVDINKGVA